MENIKNWFNQVKNLVKTFEDYDSEYVIYKGFKLTKRGEEYFIQDVRFSNLYSEVTVTDLNKFIDKGFIKGADLISFERDTKRILSYKKMAEVLYDRRRKFTKELSKNRALNEKRIRNINRRIEEYIDLMFFYEVRVKQFNIKNKKNE